jgi:Mn-containing catalase
MTGDSEGASIQAQSSDIAASETIQELLVDQLRDLLHAERQLLKALPKMAQSSRFTQLKIEEGEEVMEEGKKKEDAPADLSLILRLNAWSIMRLQAIARPEIWPSNFETRP